MSQSQPPTPDPRSPTPDPQAPPPAPGASAWHYGEPGVLIIPHTAVSAAVVRLLPFVAWIGADATATTYRVTPARLRQAARRGWDAAQLWAVLDAHAGPPPAAWASDLAAPSPSVRIEPALVVTVDAPAVLDRAAQHRTVRRYLQRVAPGIGQVAQDEAAPLIRALERQQLTVTSAAPLPTAPPTDLCPADCAVLLVASAFYREHAPTDAPMVPHAQLEQRLHAALPTPLRQATEQVLADIAPTAPAAQPRPTATPWQPVAPPEPLPPLTEVAVTAAAGDGESGRPGDRDDRPRTMDALRRTLARRQVVTITYTNAQGDTSTRIIRPLELAQRYDTWYLRAYCHTHRAERTFRVDRIERWSGGAGER